MDGFLFFPFFFWKNIIDGLLFSTEKPLSNERKRDEIRIFRFLNGMLKADISTN
jgi:hypothetical protein